MEPNQNFISPAAVGGALCPEAPPIVAPTNYVVQDICHPQIQPIIHPTELIKQHHCVPVPKHICTFSSKDVFIRSARKSGKTSRASVRSRKKK
ncbi:hypothetical protein [Paenibacillus sp. GCM10027626]|uniref:hypothetical protein n=1 Tax=Paenibacillus sp. GCM10027626 TaxID=3273411 RepID=UPI0036389136